MAAPNREKLKLRLMHLGSLLRRPMTLGVRAVVADGEERIMLNFPFTTTPE
jgi:hypothetical protein